VALLKSGPDTDSVGPNPSVIYGDWREVQGVRWPHERALVEGLGEKVVSQFKTVKCDVLLQITEAEFKAPENADPSK
jgi:hypothetical protein